MLQLQCSKCLHICSRRQHKAHLPCFCVQKLLTAHFQLQYTHGTSSNNLLHATCACLFLSGYCFVPKVAKKTTPALCPPGFTLVAAENRCKKDAGFECPKGYTLSVDAFGAAVCKYCKTFYSVAADGKCALPCKSGYDVALIKGIKYCVQSCKEGFYSTSNDCISTKKQYKPKECSDKLCLPNFKLYFTAPGAEMSSGRKLSESKPMPAAPKASSTCVCALTDPRDVYAQVGQWATAHCCVLP